MIVWIKHSHSFKDALPNYILQQLRKMGAKTFKENDFLVQEGSWGVKIYPKMIGSLQDEIEVVKHEYGALTNTYLDTYLQARGIKNDHLYWNHHRGMRLVHSR